jgi:hypothetical protein
LVNYVIYNCVRNTLWLVLRKHWSALKWSRHAHPCHALLIHSWPLCHVSSTWSVPRVYCFTHSMPLLIYLFLDVCYI